MSEAKKEYRVGGYVKRVKLNLREADDIRRFHRQFFENCFSSFINCDLEDVYIDITGCKETKKRPEMLRLMRDCADDYVYLNPPDHQKWLSGVVTAIANLDKDR